jgi:hypothetical protein
MPAPRHFKIFLASPGDVLDEREIALDVLAGIPYDPLLRGNVTTEDVAWDKRGAGTPILAGVTPQDSVAAGLPLPSLCAIVVVIFWSRMGTPLPPSYVKSDGSRYESGTEWEYEEAVAAFREKGSPYVLLYRRTQEVLLNPALPDFHERYDQFKKVERFFEKLRGPDGSATGGYTGYETPGDFRERLEGDLKALIARLLETPEHSTSERVELPEPWPGSPFPGLRAFTAADAPIFFGREREIDALIGGPMKHPLSAVVGASGSGKSSLVAAGVLPRLQLTAGAGGVPEWLVLQFTPDRLGTGDPFATLAAAVLQVLPQTQRKALAAELQEHPVLLATLLHEELARHGGGRAVVFVDQFEELFTTIRPTLRGAFIEVLQQLAQYDEIRTIITVRADFYGNCVEMRSLARMIQKTTYPLSAPGVAALYDMITRPAARAALTFEEGLPQRILDETGQEPGALALMAYLLDELYRRAGAGGRLTHAAYEELGGVQGVIGKRSEGVFDSLDEDEKAALPRVFRELVEVDERGTATRQRALLARAAATAAAKRLTDAFTEARLLVQSRGEHNEPVVEVAHEALFRSWSRLADWIAEARDDLRLLRQVRIAATEWDRNGRRPDFLWSHERLEPVYALRERMEVEFDEVTAEFIRPEYERVGEAIRAQTQYFRQRPHIERLAAIGPSAAETLVDSLQYAKTLKARMDIYAALTRFGAAALPYLLDAVVSPSFTARHFAAEALTYVKASAATDRVAGVIQDSVPEVRAAGALLAAHARAAHAIPDVRNLLNESLPVVARSAIFALATFPSSEALEGLLLALQKARPLRADVLSILLDIAPHGRPYIYRFELGGIEDYLRLRRYVRDNDDLRNPEDAAATAKALRLLLADENAVHIAAIYRLLAALRHPDAVDMLCDAAIHGRSASRASLVEALVTSEAPVALELALTIAESTNDSARLNALTALQQLSHRLAYLGPGSTQETRAWLLDNAVGSRLRALTRDAEPGIRGLAAMTIEDLARLRGRLHTLT